MLQKQNKINNFKLCFNDYYRSVNILQRFIITANIKLVLHKQINWKVLFSLTNPEVT